MYAAAGDLNALAKKFGLYLIALRINVALMKRTICCGGEA